VAGEILVVTSRRGGAAGWAPYGAAALRRPLLEAAERELKPG
jgi:hypothetical protein